MRHIFCDCPAHEHIRELVPEHSQTATDGDTLCQLSSITGEVKTIVAAAVSIQQHISIDVPSRQISSDSPIYTDGACAHQKHADIRRAGCGVCFSENGEELFISLPGEDHTALRAEIWAGVLAVFHSCGNIAIAIDNSTAVKGFTRLFSDPLCDISGWDNWDLWLIAQGIIINRISDNLRCVKVKGHAQFQDVQHCHELIAHKIGNDTAASLAVQAVDHEWCNALHFEKMLNLSRIANIQARNAAILLHRFRQHPQVIHDEAIDYRSNKK